MPVKKLGEEKRKEIEQLAAAWGRLLAQEAFPKQQFLVAPNAF